MFNNNNIIKVQFEKKFKCEVKEGTAVQSIIPKSIYNMDEVIAVKVNNEVHSIYYKLSQDSICEPITYYSEEGERIYARSLKFLLLMAIHKLYPELKLEFTNKIGRDYLVKVSGIELTKDVVSAIKEEMKNIISENLPISKLKVNFETAKKIYSNMNSLEQLENFKIKIKETYTFYECDGYYNYLYGLIVPNTAFIKAFDLVMFRNALVLVLPNKDDVNNVDNKLNPNKIYKEFEKFKDFSNIIGISYVSDVNENVLTGDIGKIIRYSEAEQDRRLINIAQTVAKRKKVKVIFIAGPSSSGKTTFSQRLAEQLKLDGKNSIPLAMDNYFQDKEFIPKDENGEYDYENVTNVDIELFEEHLLDMLEGYEVEVPEYNFKESRKEYKGRKIRLKENDILIVEGIHALNPVMSKRLNKANIFKIYIAPLLTLGFDNYTKVSSNDTRLLRRIVRDSQARAKSAEDTLKMWKKVREGEEEYIFPYVKEADVIYNTSLIYEVGVLKAFAENLLLKVDSTSSYYSDARRLYKMLQNFRSIETSEIPLNSIIKEFVGKGCFYR